MKNNGETWPGEKLILQIKELYKEIAIKIRPNEKSSNIFKTNKGLRHGMPSEPITVCNIHSRLRKGT